MWAAFYEQPGTRYESEQPPYYRILLDVINKFAVETGRQPHFEEQLVLEQCVMNVELQLLRNQQYTNDVFTSAGGAAYAALYGVKPHQKQQQHTASGYMKATAKGTSVLEQQWAQAAYNLSKMRMSSTDIIYWQQRYKGEPGARGGVFDLKSGVDMASPYPHDVIGRPQTAAQSQRQPTTDMPYRGLNTQTIRFS